MKTERIQTKPRTSVGRCFAAGLGLVELLIALAITAMLLTSVAVAFHASLATVEQNQKIASATQVSRIALHRIMAESRRADAVETAANRVSILPPDDGSGMTLSEYELLNGTLWYRQRINGVTTNYSLLAPADGVDSEGEVCITDITARLDLEVDGNRFTVTASSNPRRSLDW